MEKRFYDGPCDGLYVPSEFFKFMRLYEKDKRAKVISEDDEDLAAGNNTYLKVYHLEHENVTLKYAVRHSHDDIVTVTLFGNRRGISDVEEIIATEIAQREAKEARGKKRSLKILRGRTKR